MRLLLLPDYFQPEVVASTMLHDQRYKALAKENVEMLCYTPYPTRGIDDAERKKYCTTKTEKLYDGMMELHRFPLYKEGKNPILRALRYVLQCIMQFNRAVFAARDIDVLTVGSTPPIQGMMAGFVKIFRGFPLVYYLQDIFPDSLVGTGLAKKSGLLWRIGRVVENFTYKYADKIIVISEDFKKNILAKGVPEEKIVVIYNWVDQDAVVPVPDVQNELFEEFGVSREKFRVVYAGNLGNAQNIEIILDAARRLKDNQDIEFLIFGTGGLEPEIKAAKESEKLDNLHIMPLQPYERVSKVYGLGDVCIVACKPGLGGAAMPSKTWSIMSAGRAVLANFDEGELKQIVEQNGCGVFTQAGDLDGFVSAIETLSKDKGRCREMGAKGREFILNNLTKEVGTQKYVDVIKSVVKER